MHASHEFVTRDFITQRGELRDLVRQADVVLAAGLPVRRLARYEPSFMGDNLSGTPLLQRWAAAVTVPTLVMAGESSEPWQHRSVQGLTELLPDARRHTFPGADHGVAPEILAPVLSEFCETP
jgi:pimeloyl-ACP methyl ester carboxylesterase